ncbi:MAG: hypothetical protein FWD11_05700 [Micrococcales bacterium]|nr:hypothetical protein [Micrococcales bacterium]
MTLDWAQLADELVAGAVGWISQTVADRPDTKFVAAAVHKPYTDQIGVIYLGGMALLTEEEHDKLGEDLWLATDWEHQVDWWIPQERFSHWEAELGTLDVMTALADPPRDYESQTYDALVDVLVDVARRTRDQLEADGTVDQDFVIVVIDSDDDYQVALTCLRPGEAGRWFPNEAAV